MRSCVALFIILVSGFRGLQSQESHNILEAGSQLQSIINAVEAFMQKRCKENAGPKFENEILSTLQLAQECFNKNYPKPATANADMNRIICSQVPWVFRTCLESIVDKMESCLKPEERYFHDFIFSSFNATFRTFCKDDAKLLAEYGPNNFMMTEKVCSLDKNSLNEIIYNTYVPKLTIEEDFKKENFVLTKSYFCGVHKIGIDCLEDIVTKCSNKKMLKFFELSLEPYKDWCKISSSTFLKPNLLFTQIFFIVVYVCNLFH